MSEEERLDEKPLWEQFGFESLEELSRFHQYEMARRRAARPLLMDEEAENQAEHLSKKAEKAAEPEKADKIKDPDSKSAESGNNEETPKGLDAGDNTTSATNK